MNTKNFKQEEYACKCGCGEMRISPTIMLLNQMVRDHFGKPTIVTSGCRCSEYNEKVGGVDDSQHKVKGDDMSHASDIIVKGVPSKEVYKFLDKNFPNSLGLGLYKEFVHIDDRMDRAYRWTPYK